MEQSKVAYWRKVVSAFEKEMPESVRNRARYRARKAERLNLSPIQIALVRYSWAAFFGRSEDLEQVRRRWQSYLFSDLPRPKQGRRTVGQLEFGRRRLFQELIRGVQSVDLWPWGNQFGSKS
jgi:hypothetical protein